MPRVPGDVPQVPFQPTQMPGYQAPAVQPSQNFMPQQLQQLAGGIQDIGQASSRIGSSMQRQELAEQEAMEARAREQERIQARLQQEQDRLDETEAKNKINEYRKFAITKRTEFGRLEGASAPQQYSKYVKDIKDYGDELYKGLANDTQRKIFSSSRDIFEFDTTSAMDSHSYSENKRYQRETSQSSAKINSQTYTDAYVESVGRSKLEKLNENYGLQSQSRIPPEVYRAAMEADIRNYMEGQPEESIKVEIDKAVKATHASTLEALAAKKDFDSINEYISNNEKEIDPKTVIDYRKIAASTKASFDANKFAISIANKYRNESGYFGDEQYSYVNQYVDNLYASDENKWDPETYKEIKTALRSLKEADSAIRAKVESALVDEAVKQIEFQKSAQAREGYSNWVESNRSNMEFNESMKGMGIEIDIESPGVVPIVADDAAQAERAFAAFNPVLYAKLEAAGKLKELRDNFKGGGKSDPAALEEIQQAISSDPNFLARYPLEQFQAVYGLRLSREHFMSYQKQMVEARTKAEEQINAISKDQRDLVLNRALYDNGYANIDGSSKDESKSKTLPFMRADIDIQWDKHSTAYKAANSGKSPGREEYEEFIKTYFDDRKRTGIDKNVSEMGAEDLSKVFAVYRDNKSGQTYSQSISNIDQPLIRQAVDRVVELNNHRHSVYVGDALIERFATATQAQQFIDSGAAAKVANQRGAPPGVAMKRVEKMLSTSQSSTDVGNTALQLMAEGKYKHSDDAEPIYVSDSDTRANRIVDVYKTRISESKAQPGLFTRGMIAANSAMISMVPYEQATYEKAQEEQLKLYGKTQDAEFKRFATKIESIRDDIANDKGASRYTITSEEAMALTGLSAENLMAAGALVTDKIRGDRGGSIASGFYVTTAKFEDIVKETYSYTVKKLKTDDTLKAAKVRQ